VVQCDVSDEQQVEAMFDQAEQAFGALDILMNNAGVDASGTHVADLPTEVFDRAIRVNVYGYFFCCRRFAQIRTAAGGGGKVINVTSVHEDVPNPGGADYDCSKGALRMLTRTLALELAPLRVNVNSLAPGMVLTPFNQPRSTTRAARQAGAEHPVEAGAEPAEIARLAVFLASSDADYVTGATYVMDGGLMRNSGRAPEPKAATPALSRSALLQIGGGPPLVAAARRRDIDLGRTAPVEGLRDCSRRRRRLHVVGQRRTTLIAQGQCSTHRTRTAGSQICSCCSPIARSSPAAGREGASNDEEGGSIRWPGSWPTTASPVVLTSCARVEPAGVLHVARQAVSSSAGCWRP
jgi:glucose 1-dehydrogenase